MSTSTAYPFPRPTLPPGKHRDKDKVWDRGFREGGLGRESLAGRLFLKKGAKLPGRLSEIMFGFEGDDVLCVEIEIGLIDARFGG
jgi:hypothetical protein